VGVAADAGGHRSGALGLGRAAARSFGDVPPDRLPRLHLATAGNPLGLLELGARLEVAEAVPRESATAVSERITRSFVGRAHDLDDDAGLALLVAAADGASVATVHQACAALGVEGGALGRAEDAGLITLRGDRVEFRHPLVRSAVYGAAEPDTRRQVHRALADAVPRDEAARLAWHLSRGALAPDEDTASTLDVVGAEASHRGAHAIAASAHERAAALTATPTRLAPRLAAAAEASLLAGLTDRAVELLDRALAAQPDPYLRAHIHELRGALETRAGSLEKAHSLLVNAAEEIEDLDPDRAVRLYADVVHVCFYRAQADAAMRAGEAIERLLETASDPDARYLGTVASGMALILKGDGVRGVAKVRDASYQLVVGDNEPEDEFRLPLRLQGALWLRGSGPHRAMVTAAIDRMRDEAALGSLPYVLMHIARDAATTDRWEDAETAYAESIRLARETGQSTELAASLAGLAIVNARRGQEQECRENSAAAEPLCRSHGIRLGDFWRSFAQGDLLAGKGDLAGAARHYESLREGLSETGLSDPDQSCLPELVETYVHLGRLEEATTATAEFAASAEAKGQPWSLARAERARALCAPGGGGHDAGPERHFRRALELHAQTTDLYETARTQLAFGAWLRRDRQRVAARPMLRAALSTFERLGAVPWADKAAQELAATGETVRRREASAVDELTPQERQIAQLLAEGRTTREAAAALFISPKTVEYHLRHVYLKLGIRSRAALAEIFVEPAS
jgi:DNA-binding CsgD family transcriptional regulator